MNDKDIKLPQLAVVIPCYNEELCVENAVKKLSDVISFLVSKDKISKDSYIYLVDDGSKDSTWEIIKALHKKVSNVKGTKFITNFGNQKAILAGLESVNEIGCDCAVTIDADLQQDEWVIEKFVDEYSKGFDLVLGVRNNRDTDTFFKKWTALFFYKLMNLLGAKIQENHSDYRLVSKNALNVLKLYNEKMFFLRGFFCSIGLKTQYVNFDVKNRMAGKSKFNFTSLMAMALTGITSYSVIPLRIVAVLGLLMSLFAFLMGIEVLFEKFLLHSSPNGWATEVTLLCAFGGIQLFCLGIIGEYIGQLYNEVKARPRYIKEEELK